MVDSYRIQYAYLLDRANPEYKASWNQSRNMARVFTPEDRAIQTPSSDTPCFTRHRCATGPVRPDCH